MMVMVKIRAPLSLLLCTHVLIWYWSATFTPKASMYVVIWKHRRVEKLKVLKASRDVAI